MTDELLGSRNLPICPICGNTTFRQERGKIDSEWGMTAHKVTLLVCERCSYVLAFYDGNTIFDFD
jgi:RNA polymerase subunit RPABC4/transcription elongation factor Spt4